MRRDSTSGSGEEGRRMKKIDPIRLQMLHQLYELVYSVEKGARK